MGSVLTGSKVVRGAMNVHYVFKGGRREQPTNGEEEAVPQALSTAALRGRLELEGAMRIGGIRLVAFLLLYVTMLNAYTAVTPNDSLFEVNAFLKGPVKSLSST